jgi:hypothetical protein
LKTGKHLYKQGVNIAGLIYSATFRKMKARIYCSGCPMVPYMNPQKVKQYVSSMIHKKWKRDD